MQSPHHLVDIPSVAARTALTATGSGKVVGSPLNRWEGRPTYAGSVLPGRFLALAGCLGERNWFSQASVMAKSFNTAKPGSRAAFKPLNRSEDKAAVFLEQSKTAHSLHFHWSRPHRTAL